MTKLILDNGQNNEIDISTRRGDSLDTTITVIIDGVGFDFTGWTNKMQVKRRKEDQFPVLELTSASGITVNGSEVTLKRTSDEMNIDAIEYVYDFEATKGTEKITLFAGLFQVVEDVTK